jgi:hypothetical protein
MSIVAVGIYIEAFKAQLGEELLVGNSH